MYGGKRREDSVYAGLTALGEDVEFVVVHDGARPFLSREVLQKAIEVCDRVGAAVVAVPAVDTMKIVVDGFVEATPPRSQLYHAQTPQVFRREVLFDSYCRGRKEGVSFTDDSELVASWGHAVAVVEGERKNLKITTKSDLDVAESILKKEEGAKMKIGIGYDVHRLTPGRKLVLGGVVIPHDRGLEGHSDADVLVHAIMDALLGSLALGDIGQHFPDTDPSYKDIDSTLLLERVAKLVEEKGYRVSNVDTVLEAQAPKLMNFLPAMRQNIAKILGVEEDQVSVKATTTERLGFVGREEGIACQAVCLLERYD